MQREKQKPTQSLRVLILEENTAGFRALCVLIRAKTVLHPPKSLLPPQGEAGIYDLSVFPPLGWYAQTPFACRASCGRTTLLHFREQISIAIALLIKLIYRANSVQKISGQMQAEMH